MLTGRIKTLGRRQLSKKMASSEARGGLTQREIAALVGASEKAFWAWKHGTRRPNELMKERLFQVLGIMPHAWLTSTERRERRAFERQKAA